MHWLSLLSPGHVRVAAKYLSNDVPQEPPVMRCPACQRPMRIEEERLIQVAEP